jgi:undecaprenyl pyrophosphate phosphatase UppP
MRRGRPVVAVNFLMSYLKTNTLIPFAVRCASLGAALIV